MTNLMVIALLLFCVAVLFYLVYMFFIEKEPETTEDGLFEYEKDDNA